MELFQLMSGNQKSAYVGDISSTLVQPFDFSFLFSAYVFLLAFYL